MTPLSGSELHLHGEKIMRTTRHHQFFIIYIFSNNFLVSLGPLNRKREEAVLASNDDPVVTVKALEIVRESLGAISNAGCESSAIGVHHAFREDPSR